MLGDLRLQEAHAALELHRQPLDDVVVEDCTIRDLDNTGLYVWSESSPHPRDPAWNAWRHTAASMSASTAHIVLPLIFMVL